jgi:3-deoxy-D-manno-octulosonic acid (KDO) 8-phosphate synthase
VQKSVAGNRNILITKTGASFATAFSAPDMRLDPDPGSLGYPCRLRCDPHVLLPEGPGGIGRDTRDGRLPARAATATEWIALILRSTRPGPGPPATANSIALDSLRGLLMTLQGIDRLVKKDMKKGR